MDGEAASVAVGGIDLPSARTVERTMRYQGNPTIHNSRQPMNHATEPLLGEYGLPRLIGTLCDSASTKTHTELAMMPRTTSAKNMPDPPAVDCPTPLSAPDELSYRVGRAHVHVAVRPCCDVDSASINAAGKDRKAEQRSS